MFWSAGLQESFEMRTERYVVGITGGIGSGKSAVTDYLETKGITVVDADKVARVVSSLAPQDWRLLPNILVATYSYPTVV